MKFYFFNLCLLLFFSVASNAQSISGTVKNIKGEPLVNANVFIENNNRGTITNNKGFFQFFNLKQKKYKIVVSYIGYTTQKKAVKTFFKKNTNIDFCLKKNNILTQEILIEANKKQKSEVTNIPVRIKRIEAIEIQKIPAVSVSSLLSTVSGVNVKNEFGIFSSSTVVSLRGFNSQSGTLVVLDGTPINKSDAGSVNWNLIDKDNIEKLEIIKGPGSVLYGSNAMGGIINIVSKKYDKKIAGTFSSSYGTYNTFQSKFRLSGKTENDLFYWRVFGSYKQSDGYINTPDEIIEENDTIVEKVYLKENLVGGLLGYNIDNNNQVELSFNYFNDLRGRGIKIYETDGSNVEHDTYHLFAKYKGKIKKCEVFSNFYFLRENYGRQNEYYSDGAYTLYEVDSKREDKGCRIWLKQNLNKKIELIEGFEAKIGSVNGKDIYYTSTDLINNKGKMNTFSAFAQAKFNLISNKLSLVSGLRFDNAVFRDAFFSITEPSYSIQYLTDFQFNNIQDKSWNSFSPKLSIEFTPESEFKTYVSVAKGFSSPTLDDLCRTGRKKIGFKIANPQLKPEHIYNFEIGSDYKILNIIKTSVSLYYTIGQDFMYFVSTGDSVNLGYTIAPIFKVDNISAVEIYGAEADISFPITNSISSFINYTYTHSTIKKSEIKSVSVDKDLTGKFLTDIPMHKFSLGLNYENKFVNIGINGNYIGERWINDENKIDEIYLLTDKYPERFITNLKLWKKIKQFNISLDFNNIFNKIYTNSKGFKCPGRFVVLEIKYKLK
ncbi:MAG: TonB-dependent receptor [Bacteroidetes bacterium]|nr:TonB-dependent receptor [Bacteroidota bacterium]